MIRKGKKRKKTNGLQYGESIHLLCGLNILYRKDIIYESLECPRYLIDPTTEKYLIPIELYELHNF
jgi:hypothetical protein